MSRIAEFASGQEREENLSGNDMFECQRWIEEMHEVAVGIETENSEWKKRMNNLTKENEDG